MKALTIHEPYATLIRLGYGLPQPLKQYETRHWHTSHRGTLAIHAGKNLASLNELAATLTSNYRSVGNVAAQQIEATLRQYGYSLLEPQSFPTGKVLCVCELVACLKMDSALIVDQPQLEQVVGFWSIGRFAWRLKVVQIFESPIPAVGAQGLWEWKPPS